MINLIPNQEKKKMVRNFYFRFLVVFFIVLGICFLFAFVVILPGYFVSLQKMNFVNTKLESQQKEVVPVIDGNILAEIKDLNNKLGIIENAEKNKFNLSSNIINEIVLFKTPDIKITKISYNNDPLSGKKISINGNAPSREALLSFRLILEKNPAFKKVDLPIANFIKGSNIQFFINLIPA